MAFLELRTLFLIYVVFSAVGVIMMFSLWRQNRKRSPEISLWLADYVLQLVALLLVLLRGFIPDILSIVAANAFIIGGTVALYVGLQRYVGKESRQWHNFTMVAVFTLVHGYFTYVRPDLAVRNINLSAALFFICAQAAWLMLRRVDAALLPATGPLGMVFIGFCIVSLVHVANNILGSSADDLFRSGPIESLVILADQILYITLTFLLFLMVSRRLLMQLEDELSERRQAEEYLRRSEEKFSRAFQTSPYAISITRIEDGKIIEVNDAFISMTGYSRGELVGSSTIGLKLWADEKDRDLMLSLLREGSAVSGREFLFRNRDGGVMTGILSTQMIMLYEGPCILSSINNITDRKMMENDLRRNRRFLSELVEHSGALICVKDASGRYELVNRKWEEVTGISRMEALGKTDKELFPGPIGEQFMVNDLKVFRTGDTIETEEVLEDSSGKRYFISVKFPLKGDEGEITGLCGMITEITARKEAEEKIRHLANHDVLTDLPSLRLANDRLSRAVNMARRYKKMAAAMFIDLDGFKAVNDSFGHDAGDNVLREVARRLTSCVRETDTVARVGGDEFLMIVTELRSPDDAALIAEKAIALVSMPIEMSGRRAVIGASIGIALYPADGHDNAALIKEADAAMYRVKVSGKNGFAFAGGSG